MYVMQANSCADNGTNTEAYMPMRANYKEKQESNCTLDHSQQSV